MTVSIGVATLTEVPSFEPTELLNLADQRMLIGQTGRPKPGLFHGK